MNSSAAFLFLSVMAGGVAMADLPPQPQVDFVSADGSVWNGVWEGVAARVYFMQASLDLVTWDYVPDIKFGTGLHTASGANTNAPKFFFRLKYYDNPSLTSLLDAKNDDYDFDGLSNWAELTGSPATDPFDSEDPGGDDDLLNRFEHSIGSSPLVGYVLGSITGVELFLPTE